MLKLLTFDTIVSPILVLILCVNARRLASTSASRPFGAPLVGDFDCSERGLIMPISDIPTVTENLLAFEDVRTSELRLLVLLLLLLLVLLLLLLLLVSVLMLLLPLLVLLSPSSAPNRAALTPPSSCTLC
jgi:hypothetical protein